MKKLTLSVTSDPATQTGTTTSSQSILGKLYAILYKPGSIATGGDITITTEGIFSHTLLIKANAGTSDTLYYPRDLVHQVEDGAELSGSAGGDRCEPLLNGRPQIAVAQAGTLTARTGSIILYYEAEMKHIVFDITCDGSGAATVNVPSNILGELYAILYKPGTIDTGATLTVTSQGAFAKPLLTKAGAGTSDTLYYPRDLEHAPADGSALTGTAGGDREEPLINGTPRVTISAGGAGGVGQVILYYES